MDRVHLAHALTRELRYAVVALLLAEWHGDQAAQDAAKRRIDRLIALADVVAGRARPRACVPLDAARGAE